MKEQRRAVISAAIVLIVNIAAIGGVDLDGDALTNGVLAIAALVADLYAIWKNHNFTSEAVQAQKYLDGLKAKR